MMASGGSVMMVEVALKVVSEREVLVTLGVVELK